MKKPLIIIIASILIIILITYFKGENKYDSSVKTTPIKSANLEGYKNTTYILDGEAIALKNGISETESAPGSAMKTTTTYFGNEVKRDFDEDGREDIAFILSQETGGTGVFFYLVVALNKIDGYKGSEGYFIGDRISPQTTEMGEGNTIIVNYVDRAEGEGFASDPSVGKSLRLRLDVKKMILDQADK